MAWAVLRSANMRGADLRGADLSRADLSDAAMQDADLRGVVLCRTIMPSGLVKNPECPWWKIDGQSIGNEKAVQAAARPPQAMLKPAGNSGPGLDVAAFLGRLFDFTVTPPGDREAETR